MEPPKQRSGSIEGVGYFLGEERCIVTGEVRGEGEQGGLGMERNERLREDLSDAT